MLSFASNLVCLKDSPTHEYPGQLNAARVAAATARDEAGFAVASNDKHGVKLGQVTLREHFCFQELFDDLQGRHQFFAQDANGFARAINVGVVTVIVIDQLLELAGRNLARTCWLSLLSEF